MKRKRKRKKRKKRKRKNKTKKAMVNKRMNRSDEKIKRQKRPSVLDLLE